ncbi:MAG: FitA-like ribbon-helix-helix domain-containing protein [Angustibacter sp.]
MTRVQVRDVPEDVVEKLKYLARERNQSLQRYLRDVLQAEAGIATNKRILAEAATEAKYPARYGEAAEDIERGRSSLT